MDILYLEDKIDVSACLPLIIYKENRPGKVKRQMSFQSKHWEVDDYNIAQKFYSCIKNLYNDPLLYPSNSSICNYLSVIEFNKGNYINTWNFFDQIQSKPSTLTFVAKIVESDCPISVEFIRDGQYSLNNYSVLIFPSCFKFGYRINPIKSDIDCIAIGSILFEK